MKINKSNFVHILLWSFLTNVIVLAEGGIELPSDIESLESLTSRHKKEMNTLKKKHEQTLQSIKDLKENTGKKRYEARKKIKTKLKKLGNSENFDNPDNLDSMYGKKENEHKIRIDELAKKHADEKNDLIRQRQLLMKKKVHENIINFFKESLFINSDDIITFIKEQIEQIKGDDAPELKKELIQYQTAFTHLSEMENSIEKLPKTPTLTKLLEIVSRLVEKQTLPSTGYKELFEEYNKTLKSLTKNIIQKSLQLNAQLDQNEAIDQAIENIQKAQSTPNIAETRLTNLQEALELLKAKPSPESAKTAVERVEQEIQNSSIPQEKKKELFILSDTAKFWATYGLVALAAIVVSIIVAELTE
ncbi:hypothetical protein HYV11_02225 [Candidatus Dependentiae bacterium]|nr:hypothetical protein [Candidatus Dependentiae bacterium]